VKLLVIRFSSIGDIVLTTPILRAIKQQFPDATIHYVTKRSFTQVLKNNPTIDRLIVIDKSIHEVVDDLKKENYTHLIDLHNNLRTFILKLKLGKSAFSFPKLNIRKWLFVRFKINLMPDKHVVQRYFQAVEKLGIVNENNVCEFYIDAANEVSAADTFQLLPKTFVTIAIGAQFATKRMPLNKLNEIIQQIEMPVVLIGGDTDNKLATELIESNKENKILYNACGKYNLLQSASIVRQSLALLTNDTGMMHIASCFQLPIVSVWGNTHPAFGMYPYLPENRDLFSMHQVPLKCRPCSKIGFNQCPKKHFNCMNLQKSGEIATDLMNKSGMFIKE
jgi:ADP-heptose:LPS heptosyltransferase